MKNSSSYGPVQRGVGVSADVLTDGMCGEVERGDLPTGESLYRRMVTEPKPPVNVPVSAEANGESASSGS